MMNKVTTGTGLALLAGSIMAFPFVNRVSHMEPAAHAQPPVEAAKAISVSAASQSDVPCPGGPPRDWLSPAPKPVQLCPAQGVDFGSIPCHQTSRADVNGDGSDEFFVAYTTFTPITNGGQPVDIGSITLRICEITQAESGPRVEFTPVFPRGTSIGSALQAAIPGVQSAVVQLLGWRDMDQDGDLDMLCYIEYQTGGNCCESKNYFFENIGFERSPPLAADLNRDGYVNGLDLGLLLGQWGPST
jgi:hypothetical protein